jgi:tetratricopeptide (TPR) repeat protein
VTLYRIVRASGGRRFGARTLTPLVGREEELDHLRRRWERAAKGEGQFVQIVGEPGIGKSRLVEEFRLTLGETPHTWAEFSSSQLLQNTPLHPVAEWGRQRFGDADVAAGQRLADLENTLQLIGLDPAEHAPLIAPLVDIPLPPGRAANLPPEELRRRQLAALIAWFLAGARSQPAALAFEDLHWLDPTSLDLMQALAERGRMAPLFIIATARPEFRPPWSLRSHHSVISLSPLDRAHVAQMVGELASRHAFSKEVVEGVSERTGGIPLFVEEVTRLMLERGEQGGAQAIPPTLQQSLAARLDRLGEAREVAQIGAVLGRDFTYSLLRAVGGVDDPALQFALDKLAEADLLIAEGAGHEANYRFKHALIQDAAYDSLLKSRRQALHRRAAELLRDQPERAAAEPEVIAHHFTQAGLDELAIEWWGKAGDQALRRSAFQEAIAHLGKAIAMADKTTTAAALTTVPATDASLRVKLQKDYAQAVQWSKGWGAAETKVAFERTDALATRAEMSAARFPGLFSQAVWNLARGETRAARDIADFFLREAEAEGRMAEVGVARYVLGLASMFSGELADARSHLQKALDTYDKERDRKVMEEFGFGNGSNASGALAVACWLQGDLQRARQLIEEAVWLGNEGGHLPTALNALTYKTIIESFGNDLAGLVGDAEKVLTTSRQLGMEFYAADAGARLSWARGRLGEAGHAADELKNSLDAYSRQGNRLSTPLFLGFLADLKAAAGDYEGALAGIKEGLAIAQDSGQNYTDAFLHRSAAKSF